MHPPTRTDDGLERLDRAECVRLLRDGYVARLGYVDEGRPVIVPVNYCIDADGNALVLTAPGRKLDAARAGGILSVQVGGHDDVYHTGWSVLLSGHAEVLDDFVGTEAAVHLLLRPWARKVPRTHLLRIAPERVEGRRIP